MLSMVLFVSFVYTCIQFWNDLTVLPRVTWLPFYVAVFFLLPYLANLYALYLILCWRRRGVYLFYVLIMLHWCLSVYVMQNMKSLLVPIITAIVFTFSIISCIDDFD